MSGPWLDNREGKEMEKTQKYGPLMWNWEREILATKWNSLTSSWDSADVSQAVKEIVLEKSTTILQRMQRSVISSTLNIAMMHFRFARAGKRDNI